MKYIAPKLVGPVTVAIMVLTVLANVGICWAQVRLMNRTGQEEHVLFIIAIYSLATLLVLGILRIFQEVVALLFEMRAEIAQPKAAKKSAESEASAQ